MDMLKNITECFYELLAFKKLYEIVNVKEIIWLLYNLVVKSSSFFSIKKQKNLLKLKSIVVNLYDVGNEENVPLVLMSKRKKEPKK